jgi:hypothetical protein
LANLVIDDEDDSLENVRIKSNIDYKSMVPPEEIYDDPFNLSWEEIKKSECLSPNFRKTFYHFNFIQSLVSSQCNICVGV